MEQFLLVVLLLLADPAPVAAATGGGLVMGFQFHHRFSGPVRRWAESSGHSFPGGWPATDSGEYLDALVRHDGGRVPQLVSFSEGNATVKISALGFLHYALVSVGTPSVAFMVALDTGSDLFWLPCKCSSCATATSGSRGFEQESNYYNPKLSLTSQTISCDSNYCEFQTECSTAMKCPYKIAYVSSDTSSSGYLVEDILYLTTEDKRREIIEAQIVFGCGQIQTGSFLNAAAPNGLFGLGLSQISVPSILASKGIIADSFSMCFGPDGFGRITFGDQGSLDQEETRLHVSPIHPTYNITITGLTVERGSADMGFSALFDTGTSFTYLADPAYTYITQSFNSHVKANRHASDSRIPFEYCYTLSSYDADIQTPSLSLTTDGGSVFVVADPGQVITVEQNEYVYCLAIIKSSKLNIIGQNFMTGLRIVFDRERQVLGWRQSSCYDSEDSNYFSVNPPPAGSSLNSPSAPRGGKSPEEDAAEPGNGGAKDKELTSLGICHHHQLMASSAIFFWMLLLISWL